MKEKCVVNENNIVILCENDCGIKEVTTVDDDGTLHSTKFDVDDKGNEEVISKEDFTVDSNGDCIKDHYENNEITTDCTSSYQYKKQLLRSQSTSKFTDENGIIHESTEYDKKVTYLNLKILKVCGMNKSSMIKDN